jgi:hydroxymethylpyrimidine pyrophosphatase-like HAD family hydrolase
MDLPALVASDLDGTLLRSDGTVSDRTVAALDRLADKGIPFVMATGRPIRWLRPVLDATGTRGPVVCSNGAAIWDPETGEVLSRTPLTPELMADVVARLAGDLPGLVFAAETELGLRHEAGYPVREFGPLIRPGELAEVLSEPAIKLLARMPVRDTPLTDAAARSLAGLAEVTRSSNDGLAEISAAGVTKATGLAWVADRLGVPAAGILAFGDMPNDLPMFAYAGRSVAMANAEPAVRAAADAVTGTNDADGVASYLESLLP